jgi:hypothetical protein
MHAVRQVDAALVILGADRTDLAAAIREASEFESVPHAADLYRTVLGPPVSDEIEEGETPAGVDASRADSRTLRFHLPLWPGMHFAVRKHPSGYAWGVGFVRRVGGRTPRLETAADLAPWTFVDSEITKRFGRPRTEDDWSDWRNLSYSIEEFPGGRIRRFMLTFDFRLLQSVSALNGDVLPAEAGSQKPKAS